MCAETTQRREAQEQKSEGMHRGSVGIDLFGIHRGFASQDRQMAACTNASLFVHIFNPIMAPVRSFCQCPYQNRQLTDV